MPKKFPEFQNFGEYLYYAYANLKMLRFALNIQRRPCCVGLVFVNGYFWYGQNVQLNFINRYVESHICSRPLCAKPHELKEKEIDKCTAELTTLCS